MRFRLVGHLAILLTVLAALYLRHHIYQLGEVAVTYSTFHGLVRSHGELLYRYPSPVAAGGEGQGQQQQQQKVPKIMHQVALGKADLAKYAPAMASCRRLHESWDHRLWTDDNATDFLSEHYPDILPHYASYFQEIQRANVLRYALLHKYGGVYLDLDVSCHTALDSTPLVDLPFVSPGAYPAGVNNAFIAARPAHPFLSLLLDAVPSHDMFWGLLVRIPYVENMMSTGCMYYTNRWMSYVRRLLASGADAAAADGLEPVYILADEQGDMEPHMLRGKVTTPIFSHGGASSWHSWDAALLMALSRHYVLYALLVPVLAVSLVAASVWACRSHRRRAYLRSRRGWAPVPSADDGDWYPEAPKSRAGPPAGGVWARVRRVLGDRGRGKAADRRGDLEL